MENTHGGKREGAGRKPKADEVKAFSLASPHVEDAFRVIAEIKIDETKRPSDRIASAKIIIEYACGKPKETINQNLNFDEFDITKLVRFKD